MWQHKRFVLLRGKQALTLLSIKPIVATGEHYGTIVTICCLHRITMGGLGPHYYLSAGLQIQVDFLTAKFE